MRYRQMAYVLMLFMMAGAIIGSGCSRKLDGPSRTKVQGIVTLDGQPFPEGTIRFVPQAPTTGPATTARILDGKFELSRQTGPIIGTHCVEIAEAPEAVPDPNDAAGVAAYLETQKKKPRKARANADRFQLKEHITATVSKEGPNEFRFDLSNRQSK